MLLNQRNTLLESLSRLKSFNKAEAAVDYVSELYDQSIQKIRYALQVLITEGKISPDLIKDAHYPYVAIEIDPKNEKVEAKCAYGVFEQAGIYGITITAPYLFRSYLLEQFELLLKNYHEPIMVGLSQQPIPMPFAVDSVRDDISPEQRQLLKTVFQQPDLKRLDDHKVNYTHRVPPGKPMPLALFDGERVDFSLKRMHHYTATSPHHFQQFILLTNYQRYVDEFIEIGNQRLRHDPSYTAFVTPGDNVFLFNEITDQIEHHPGETLKSLPQMPAYHLKRADGNGITLVNIGVGPSNAKNITDHLAVLRPHCWVMLGHCAGLAYSQVLGDYVLAHAYVRDDGVLDDDLPQYVPIPPIAEVQIALQQVLVEVTGLTSGEVKNRVRTGAVYTTANRNWELRTEDLYEKFQQSRAIAVDMESATISANGLRYRVPYGTLLCVSDKPIHGEIKLRGMANKFYQERIAQHIHIGVQTMELLRERIDILHSRKLRGFNDPAFR